MLLVAVVSRTRAENQMETCGVHLDGTLFFYLRRGELPGCPLRLQRGVAPNAHRLALYTVRSKQASYKSGSCGYLCIALGSGGTICLSPVDKLILDEDLFLFLIHSSDLQEVFCLAMLKIG